MYIARVSLNDDVVFGLVEGLDPAGDPTPETLFAPIASHPYAPELIPLGPRFPLSEVKLLAPVLPSKVIAVARNYPDHAREVGGSPGDEPNFFLKPSTSVVGTGAPVLYPPSSQRVDPEAELAVVISRLCKSVPVERAADVILGYTCANDVTARDLQQRDDQWGRAKGFDTFCPIGPWIATSDFDPASAHVICEVNGELRQSGQHRRYGAPDRGIGRLHQRRDDPPAGRRHPDGHPSGHRTRRARRPDRGHHPGHRDPEQRGGAA